MIVYLHRRKDNNQPFYVGSGKDIRRAFSHTDKRQEWKNIVKECGGAYVVEVLFSGLRYNSAMAKEIQLIKLFGLSKNGGSLVNVKISNEKNWRSRSKPLKIDELQVIERRDRVNLFTPPRKSGKSILNSHVPGATIPKIKRVRKTETGAMLYRTK